MKKSRTCLLLIILFTGTVSFIISRYNSKKQKKAATEYILLSRQGAMAQNEEWIATRKKAFDLLKAVRINPEDSKSNLALAALYIQEARITGNYAYYDQAALKHVTEVLQQEPSNFEALTLKAVLSLSQHHFSDGLNIALQAKVINPYNAFLYGILIDGSVETGSYDSAVAYADKMVSIRPDMRSYSRISYLREIYGDYPGAIDAMKLAIDAGLPGDETTEWSRIQLGKLYEHIGDLKQATDQYTIALNERPGYAYAVAGLARIAMAEKNYEKAIALFLQADLYVMDNSLKEELAGVYALAGKKEEADKLYKEVIATLVQDAGNADKDETLGHYADQELAYAYLNVKNYDKALHHALQEYNRRPNNIDVNETLAWVYYSKGDIDKALSYLKAALKTNSKNPRLLCRAGLIYYKANDKIMAKSFLEEGLKNNPVLSELLRSAAGAALTAL